MGTRATVIAAVAVLGLSACAAPGPELPPPLSDDEVRAIIAESHAQWWNDLFPTEPMPEITPIREVSEGDSAAIISECAEAALPPGVAAELRDSPTSGTTGTALDRAYFRCTLQYPVEITDPTAWGLLSEAQLSWLYTYYDTRLIPCLRLSGYLVGSLPERDDFVDSIFGNWSPYYAMSPQPDTPAQWARIDVSCPPPPFGDRYRPGLVP